MPFFTFRCAECGATSELLVSVGATPPCPVCGGHCLEKILAARVPPQVPARKGRSILRVGRRHSAGADGLGNSGGKE